MRGVKPHPFDPLHRQSMPDAGDIRLAFTSPKDWAVRCDALTRGIHTATLAAGYAPSMALQRYRGSKDERDFLVVGQFVETVACLARRRVLDPSLLVDAIGLPLRQRWDSIRPFVLRRRALEQNEYIFENFEWLAMYSMWWKGTPRPRFDRNYRARQFAAVQFRA